MDMQVDAQLIRSERLKRAWSQEQLAQVSGLGIRTVQRVENGENASLETVKALAAVLELPVETLVSGTATSLPSRFRLFKPWPAFAAGCAVTVISLGSVFIMQGASAEQVAMEFTLKLDDAQVAASKMVSQDGATAVLQVDEALIVNLVPRIRNGDQILLAAQVYAIEGDLQKLVSSPSVLIEDGQSALIRISDEAGREGQDISEKLELLVTATIE
jgi:transcriptional regulator with XRE-family HTH domain